MRTNLFLLAACSLALVACDSANDISGALRVQKTLNIVDTDGSLDVLNQGERFDASLIMDEKESKFTISTGLFSRVSFPIKNLVKNQMGAFRALPQDTKQNFLVEGDISISKGVINSSGYEQCVHSYRERRVCKDGGRYAPAAEAGRPSKPEHREECHWKSEPVYGRRWVDETREVVDKDIELKFFDITKQEQLANFLGSYRLSSVVISRDDRYPCNL